MNRRFNALVMGFVLVIVLAVLTGCERPYPDQVAQAAPEQVTEPTAEPPLDPTPVPNQVYVFVFPPSESDPTTPSEDESAALFVEQPIITPTSSPSPSPRQHRLDLETYYRANYYLGWARSESIDILRNHLYADVAGLTLRSEPANDSEQVGLVIGMAELIVAGQSHCGFIPVLVHTNNMMEIITPRPEIEAPIPLEVAYTPTPNGRLYPEGKLHGWAYTTELVIIGQDALTGPMGLNLRGEACIEAKNLGFVPSGTELIVVGPPVDDYTPVLVDIEAIQLPFEEPGFAGLPVTATPPMVLSSPASGSSQSADAPAPTATGIPLPEPTTTPSHTGMVE